MQQGGDLSIVNTVVFLVTNACRCPTTIPHRRVRKLQTPPRRRPDADGSAHASRDTPQPHSAPILKMRVAVKKANDAYQYCVRACVNTST